jgi:hypothetical protein
MTTNQKGAIAELAVTLAASKAGVGVLKPLVATRYDLVLDVGQRFVRVQCKWGVRKGSVISILCRSSRRSRTGIVHRGYTPAEVDAFAAYCAEIDRCFLVPFARIGEARTIQLRLTPTRNNQRRGVNWAEEFDFDRLDWATVGAVAQLGERVTGSHEVTGSNPVGSIMSALPPALQRRLESVYATRATRADPTPIAAPRTANAAIGTGSPSRGSAST